MYPALSRLYWEPGFMEKGHLTFTSLVDLCFGRHALYCPAIYFHFALHLFTSGVPSLTSLSSSSFRSFRFICVWFLCTQCPLHHQLSKSIFLRSHQGAHPTRCRSAMKPMILPRPIWPRLARKHASISKNRYTCQHSCCTAARWCQGWHRFQDLCCQPDRHWGTRAHLWEYAGEDCRVSPRTTLTIFHVLILGIVRLNQSTTSSRLKSNSKSKEWWAPSVLGSTSYLPVNAIKSTKSSNHPTLRTESTSLRDYKPSWNMSHLIIMPVSSNGSWRMSWSKSTRRVLTPSSLLSWTPSSDPPGMWRLRWMLWSCEERTLFRDQEVAITIQIIFENNMQYQRLFLITSLMINNLVLSIVSSQQQKKEKGGYNHTTK